MTPEQFMLSHERINLTSTRKPLNGYQKANASIAIDRFQLKVTN